MYSYHARAAQARKAANRARDTRLKQAKSTSIAVSSSKRPRLDNLDAEFIDDETTDMPYLVQHLPPALFASASSALERAKSEADKTQSELQSNATFKKRKRRKDKEIAEGGRREFGQVPHPNLLSILF